MNRTNTIRVLSPSAHVTRCDGLLGLDYLRLSPIQMAASRTLSFTEGGIDVFMGQDLMGTHRAIVDLGGSVLWLK